MTAPVHSQGPGDGQSDSQSSHAIDTLARLLETHCGQQLGEARRWRVETSLRPLLRDHGLRSLSDLVTMLGRDPAGPLFDRAIDLMLNHESSFFRDLSVFKSLEAAILPALAERASEKRLRIWCAGCSTGKEAYSVAMAIKHMGAVWDDWRVSILGTDISSVAIETAKRGRYAQMEMQRGLGIGDLLRFFAPVGDDWQTGDELREMVTFRTDNLLDPHSVSGEFDLILCRNVLFYFPEDKRQDAFRQLASHARTGSYLVLGAGETLIGQDSCFTACRDHRCIYVCSAAHRSGPCCGEGKAAPISALPKGRAIG